MQISYETLELKHCCLRLEVAEERFGRTYADRLVTMIAEAEAFDTVDEWHEFLDESVTCNGDNSFQVQIGSKYIATFVSVDRNVMSIAGKRIDWSNVEFIKLTDITELP